MQVAHLTTLWRSAPYSYFAAWYAIRHGFAELLHRPTLQKSPPFRDMASRLFAETTDRQRRRYPSSFGLVVSSAKSTISLQGRISSASSPSCASLSPSSTSASLAAPFPSAFREPC